MVPACTGRGTGGRGQMPHQRVGRSTGLQQLAAGPRGDLLCPSCLLNTAESAPVYRTHTPVPHPPASASSCTASSRASMAARCRSGLPTQLCSSLRPNAVCRGASGAACRA